LQGCEAFYDFRKTGLACEMGKVTLDPGARNYAAMGNRDIEFPHLEFG
jgi:hypothetical protein